MKGTCLVIFIGLIGFTTSNVYKCDHVVYEKTGCFELHDFADDLFDERIVADGYVDWDNWDTYAHLLICRCLEAIKELKSKSNVKDSYSQISLRNKKECWSSEQPHPLLKGLKPAVSCIGLDHRSGCGKADKGECLGDDNTQFIYDIDWNAKLKEMLAAGHCLRETITICNSTTTVQTPLVNSTPVP